jgi:hypothetical protein
MINHTSIDYVTIVNFFLFKSTQIANEMNDLSPNTYSESKDEETLTSGILKCHLFSKEGLEII